MRVSIPNALRAFALVCLVLLVPVYWIYLSAPAVGVFHDDGLYLVNAISLNQGTGHATVSLPRPLPQTKYPILYPAFLAVLMRIGGGFPDSLSLLRLTSSISLAAWMWICWKLFRPISGPLMAIWIVFLTVASPWILFLSALVLPDHLFCVFTYAALMLVRPLEGQSPRSLGRVAVIGLLASAAILTRTVGVALVAGVCLIFISHRKWKELAVFTLVCVLLCGPWFLWVAGHFIPVNSVESYYTGASYGAGHILGNYGLLGAARVVGINILFLGSCFIVLLGFGSSPWAFLISTVLSVLILRGLIKTVREKVTVLEVWLVVYTGILLLWVWPPHRYVTPLLPLLFFYAARGAGLFSERPLVRSRRWALAALLASGLALEASSLSVGIRRTIQTQEAATPMAEVDDWGKTLQLMGWIREHTSKEAIISANCDPQYFLFTGRKSVRLFRADPLSLHYLFEDDARKPLGDASALLDNIVQNRITHMVLTPMKQFSEGPFFRDQMNDLEKEHPGIFKCVYDAGDGYRILEVDRTKLQKG